MSSPTTSQADAAAAASAYQARQSQTSVDAAVAAIGIWRQIDGKNLDASFLKLLPRLLAVVSAGQRKAAAAAPAFTASVVRSSPGVPQLQPKAFGGLTGDGRPMQGLLYTPVALSKQRIGQGQRIAAVIEAEEAHVAMLVRTQVQDAGRTALQSVMAAEPRIRGYVRKVHLPSCARCIILAGRFYGFSDGFLRHPNCDCTMIPVAVGSDFVTGDDPVALLKQMQSDHPDSLKKSLTEGDLAALDHGANLNQVVNAHRGMATAAGPGRTVKTTTEGTTKRGVAGKRLIAESGARSGGRYKSARAPRLTPAQIFEEASAGNWDRTEIVRQLARFGYII